MSQPSDVVGYSYRLCWIAHCGFFTLRGSAATRQSAAALYPSRENLSDGGKGKETRYMQLYAMGHAIMADNPPARIQNGGQANE